MTPPSPAPPSSPKDPGAVAAASWSRLRRFVVIERVSHWLYALFFLVAVISGLLMWIPATRLWMAGARQTVSVYHGYVGTAMVVLPLLAFLVIDRRRLARDIRDVDKWNGDDRRWFWLALRGNTLFGRDMPPQGRFNAGQKVNVVLVAAMAVGFALTGGILMHRQNVAPWLVSRALWLHTILAVCAVALFLGHLAHVFVTKHGRIYLAAMVRGWIPAPLARERHRRWWEEVTGGDVEVGAGAAAEATPAGEPSGGGGA